MHEALAKLEVGDVAIDTTSLDNVLALLAAGRFERVRTALRQADAGPALPLAFARYTAWTGDLRTAAAHWEQTRSAMAALLEGEGTEALLLASCTELERTATDLGDPQLAARLHGTARKLTAAGVAAREASGDAAIVLRLVHGWLGAEPDANRQRLRLRPILQDELDVRELRFGDGAVRLEAARTPDGWRVVVEQEAGAIPVTVLLEPVVDGEYRGARVDGKPAELVPRPHEGATLVPVQLVLDEARTLEIGAGG